MSKLTGIVSVVFVLLLAMWFAASNAGHRVTLDLGFLTLYRVPVTLVAFSGLLVGMLVMFATGIHTDLKVRQILRERLSEESQQEQNSIDRNQQDLFSDESEKLANAPAAVAAPDPDLRPESPMEGPDHTE